MNLTEYLDEKSIEVHAAVASKDEALRKLVGIVLRKEKFMDEKSLGDEVIAREKLGSTGIGEGVAIPHVHLKGVQGLHVAMMTSASGVDFDAIDDNPCRLFLIVVAPDDARDGYLKLLAEVSRLFCKENLRNAVIAAKSPAELLNTLKAASK